MLTLRILEALGETEVDNVDVVLGGLGGTNQEVVRLDVSMDDALLMHLLDALDLKHTDVSGGVKFLPFGEQYGRRSSSRTCVCTPGRGPRATCQACP